jgi:hypothetical protein
MYPSTTELPHGELCWVVESLAAHNTLAAAYPALEAVGLGRPHRAEKVNLDCGRPSQQLKRHPLGGCANDYPALAP